MTKEVPESLPRIAIDKTTHYPERNSYSIETIKKAIIDPLTGERREIETYKPITNATKSIRPEPVVSEIDVKLPLYPGSKLRLSISNSLKSTSRYIIGDLVLIKGRIYELEYSDKPINEILTNIPDVAPLTPTLNQLFPNGTSVYSKFTYKTQKQLLDHLKKQQALYSPNISFELIHPADVQARLQTNTKANLKAILEEKKRKDQEEYEKIQAQIEKLGE